MHADRELLVCDGLRKSFGARVAVGGLSFHVARGERYGLLGPNGAGKTTTISMVCGLLRRDGGSVTLEGRAIDERTVGPKALIGYVPQEVALYPTLTARENLAFFGRLYGLSGGVLTKRIDAVLELADLTDRAREHVADYSGGMQRRLNIAAALLHEPRLLVLDEPTVGVDPQSRNAILETVRALSEAGTSILYTTHYMEEAQRLCNRIGIVDDGRMIAEGGYEDLVGLVQQESHIRLVTDVAAPTLVGALRDAPGVRAVTESVDDVANEYDVLVGDARAMLQTVIAAANDAGATIAKLEVVEPDLEAVFLHLTGKALRDEP